jgi:hypothetical protein
MSKNLYTILPFYSAVSEQNRYKEYVPTHTVTGFEKERRGPDRLFCFENRLLPWTVRVARTYATCTITVKLLSDTDGGGGLDITATVAGYLTTVTDTAYHYVSFYATSDMTGYLTGVDYYINSELYLKVTVTQNGTATNLYSDRFTLKTNTQEKYHTKIEWWSTSTRAGIQANVKQFFFIDNLFKTPEYPREDEGTKVDGVMVYEKQIVQKAVRIRLLNAPEYMVDAVMMLPLADVIQVTDGLNSEKADVSALPTAECWTPQQATVKDPEWKEESFGSVAKVEIQFIKSTIVKRLNFSDMPCSCTTGSQPVTKSGTVALTADVEAIITFATAFASVNYTFDRRNAYTSSGDFVLVQVTEQLAGRVKVKALENCTLMWTAILHSNT